ncbi:MULTISPECIES: ammonium transporter [Salipiger]|nr:ammonium transporter [Salipiger bermudensis]MBN9674561.1 ammonium transporter [Salipiger bermudensis]MBR9892522.1 ammonium transporter [bacterium]MCA1284877.1 ammonium transporter [Salipiger bermudensis]
MEQELAALTERLAALESASAMSGTINSEIFYWWCTALMIAIHAGFLAYEMGASRVKNVLASGIKNILAFAFMVPTFYFFGWYIYLAFYNGLIPAADGAAGLPWDMSMGPNLADNATGIFWAAFTLFAATTASIFSGAVIERIQTAGFLILAILLGSVVWILGGAWGWHPTGWLTVKFGYHDVGAAGVVHMVAGFFALGVLINLGPRVGKFNADGSPNAILAHNIPFTITGLMLIIVGFFGFLGGCIIYMPGEQWINIYGQPATLSAFAFNTLMGMAGGIIGAWVKTRDPFWMMSGALIGIFAAASGLDVYYPPVAFVLGTFGGFVVPMVAVQLEKMGIDDAVGAFPVHGIGGLIGVVSCGIFAAGYPNVDGMPPVSLWGQIVGAVTMAVLGFVPGYVVSYILKVFGLLRVPDHIQEKGLDIVKVPVSAYPENYTPGPVNVATPAAAGTPAE